MSQQGSFTKLKEQIEAAKRDLTEMSNAETANISNALPTIGPAHDFSITSPSKSAEPDLGKAHYGDPQRGDQVKTKVVEMLSKNVVNETPIADSQPAYANESVVGEFQFFHRTKQQKSLGGLISGEVLEETLEVKTAPEALLFDQLDQRLAALESDLAQNRKHILELINLFSQLDLRQEPAKSKVQPIRRLNRLYMFWFLVGFLVVGWFSLTPSGYATIQHLLAFI